MRPLAVKLILYVLPASILALNFLIPPILALRPSLLDHLAPIPALRHSATQWVGVGLILAGRVVTIASVIGLRRALEQDRLASGGLFVLSRNPGLAGMFAFSLGNACVFPSSLLFAGFALHLAHMHRRVLMEESHLQDRFGTRWTEYATFVSRYFGLWRGGLSPRLRRHKGVSQAEVNAWFDATYRARGRRYLRPQAAYSVFVDLLGARAGQRLLDVGCGPGLLLRAARSRGLSAAGIDLSQVAAGMAGRFLGRPIVARGIAETLPFAAATFDLVTCIGSLERFLDRPRALGEMLRVARPNARFCVMVRNSSTLRWKIWDRFFGGRTGNGHQDARSLEEWRGLLESSGFDVVSVRADPWPLSHVVLPLRLANEFIFILRAHGDAVAGSDRRGSGAETRLHALYDDLARFEIWRRRLNGLAPDHDLAFRKRLVSSKGHGGTSLDSMLLGHLDLPAGARVLDAGCGFGATVFTWAAARPWNFTGICPSRVQIARARREAMRRGLSQRCVFRTQSYDEPLSGPYDAVVAIEALFHSPDLEATLTNLATTLGAGGRLVLVEDMAGSAATEADPDAARLLEHWATPRLHSLEDYRRALHHAGFELRVEFDLSHRVCARGVTVLDRRARRLHRLRRMLPLPSVGRIAGAFLGGVHLERLYRKGAMRYIGMVAARRGTDP